MSDDAAVPEQTTHEQNIERLAPAMYSAILELVYARKVSTQAFAYKSYERKIQDVFDDVLANELRHEHEERP